MEKYGASMCTVNTAVCTSVLVHIQHHLLHECELVSVSHASTAGCVVSC